MALHSDLCEFVPAGNRVGIAIYNSPPLLWLNFKLLEYKYSESIVFLSLHSSYDFSSSVEIYSLENDLPELMDVSPFFPELVVEAVGYMDEAHSPGPCCGCFGPHPN